MSDIHRRRQQEVLVQQHVWEVVGTEESGYGGFGPHFSEIANRISLARGRGPFIPRRRGPEDAGAILARSWSHGPELEANPDAYAEDVTQRAVALAVGSSSAHHAAVHSATPTLGIWQWVLYLLANHRHENLRRMAALQVDRMHAQDKKRFPILARFETRKEEDGTPITAKPEFNPAWMGWQDGIVRNVVNGIPDYRAYLELPILADALEEAGCENPIILRHLRARTKGHDARCWVVNGLLGCEDAK